MFNKNKKVFVLIQHWSVDFNSYGSPAIEVYSNKQNAMKAFEKAVDEARNDSKNFSDLEEETNLMLSDSMELPMIYHVFYSYGRKAENYIEVQLIEKTLS